MFDNGILLTAATLTVLTGAKSFLTRGSRGVVRAGRTAPQATGRRRLHHLEFSEGTSNKFYEITDLGDFSGNVELRWGRIGTSGQTQIASWAEGEKRYREKLKKGYVES